MTCPVKQPGTLRKMQQEMRERWERYRRTGRKWHSKQIRRVKHELLDVR